MRPQAFSVFVMFIGACSDCGCPDTHPHVCHLTDGGTDGRPEAVTSDACVGPRIESDPGSECRDPYEPNGDFVRAATERKAECGTTTKDAMLADETDVDVFHTGPCTFGYVRFYTTDTIRPWAKIDADVRLCLYPICTDGSTRVIACYEDTAGKTKAPDDLATSQLGFHGCCRNGTGTIAVEVDCPNSWAEVDAYIWVDQNRGAATCVPYSLTYHMSD
jgi:hypothetical protein